MHKLLNWLYGDPNPFESEYPSHMLILIYSVVLMLFMSGLIYLTSIKIKILKDPTHNKNTNIISLKIYSYIKILLWGYIIGYFWHLLYLLIVDVTEFGYKDASTKKIFCVFLAIFKEFKYIIS